MSDWPLIPLKDITYRITKGTTPTTIGGRFTEDGIGFIKVESLTDDGRIDPSKLGHIDEETNALLSRSVIEENDVLFSIAGTIGRVALASRDILPANTNQAIAIVRGNPELIDPRFLYFSLRNDVQRRHALARVVQSVQANFSLGELAAMQVAVPPLSEQYTIVEVLGALGDKIEANRRTTKLAGDLLGALYLLTKVGASIEVPLMETVEFVFGEPFDSTYFNSDDVGRPLIRIRDLKTFAPQFYTTESRPRETVVEPGDVVIGMDAEFRPTIWCGEPGLLNQRVCLARPVVGSKAFALKLLEEPLAYVESFKTGTTVSHLNKSDLQQIKVLLPSAASLTTFDGSADPLRLLIVALHDENRRLVVLRDALLPKLLSGELRVRNPEAVVG